MNSSAVRRIVYNYCLLIILSPLVVLARQKLNKQDNFLSIEKLCSCVGIPCVSKIFSVLHNGRVYKMYCLFFDVYHVLLGKDGSTHCFSIEEYMHTVGSLFIYAISCPNE